MSLPESIRGDRAIFFDDEPIESVLYELPPALVDLALWLADYYGSTPARALELVAPKLRARRGERQRAKTEVYAVCPAGQRDVHRIVHSDPDVLEATGRRDQHGQQRANPA